MPANKEKHMKILLIAATLILIALEIYSLSTDSHYKWDFIFLMLLLYALFFIRAKINLHSFHYFLFAVFLVVHNLGTFRLYEMYFFGMEYDFWVHSYFGFVASLILYRAYTHYRLYSRPFIILAVLVVVLGLSAFHELFEYAGALTVGKGEGVLFIGAGDTDEWDTQKDMLNNVIGGIAGLVLSIGNRVIKVSPKHF